MRLRELSNLTEATRQATAGHLSPLFLMVTAEEQGLYPLEKTLANINVDGVNVANAATFPEWRAGNEFKAKRDAMFKKK